MSVAYFDNKYISWDVSNPLKTWWKAKKYFRFPRLSFRMMVRNPFSTWWLYHPRKWKPSYLLDLYIDDVEWKDKYGPTHEKSPFFYLSLFNLIVVFITTKTTYINELGKEVDIDGEYWEYLLYYLEYGDLTKVPVPSYQSRLYHSDMYDWSKGKKMWMIEPIPNKSLTKEGFRKLEGDVKRKEETLNAKEK